MSSDDLEKTLKSKEEKIRLLIKEYSDRYNKPGGLKKFWYSLCAAKEGGKSNNFFPVALCIGGRVREPVSMENLFFFFFEKN